MTTVSLEGRLGHIVGSKFSFKTRTLKEVLDISAQHTLETYPAAILYHSHEKQ